MSNLLDMEAYKNEERRSARKRLQLSRAHVEFATRDHAKFPRHAQSRANLIRAKADFEIASALVDTWEALK